MFGNVTVLEGLRLTEKYKNRSMHHTCSRHAVFYPQIWVVLRSVTGTVQPVTLQYFDKYMLHHIIWHRQKYCSPGKRMGIFRYDKNMSCPTQRSSKGFLE